MEILTGLVLAGFLFGFMVACCWGRGKKDQQNVTISSRVPF